MRRQSAHVDADVLAELSAGLIGGRRATRIHAHLAGCERCSGIMAELSGVSVLLAAVPSPAMPESVTARLSSALAEEAAACSGRAASRNAFHHDPERGRGVPPRIAWRGLRGPVAARAFAAAAAACVLAAGGYTVSQLTTHGPSVSSRSPRAGVRAVRTPAFGPNNQNGLNGLNGLNGPSGPKGGFLTPQPTGTASAPPGIVLPKFTVVQSGTDYQPAQLAAQIDSELARAGRGEASPGGPGHLSSTRQEDCVYRITGGNRPTLVDDARYEGNPAMVIALAPNATQLGQAWIVGPGCSAETNDTLKHVQLSGAGG